MESDFEARYRRHQAVLESMVEFDVFAKDQIHQQVPDENPGFVTRVINELKQNGWLVHEAADSDAVYRWNRDRGAFSIQQWLDKKIFGSSIKASPEEERPREKLLRLGPEQLTTAELLAILIRTGQQGQSAVQAGEELAKKFRDRLGELPQAGRGELKSIAAAVGPTAYCQIMAGIELGRRVAAISQPQPLLSITSSTEAVAFCQAQFARLVSDRKQEEFHVVTLDTKNKVIDSHKITVGTLDASLVHPREVFRPAIKDAASSILLVHNHPSGDPTPSREDFAVTERLESVGKTLGIRVLDHIIVAAQGSQSINELR